jgi:hypothetical protein
VSRAGCIECRSRGDGRPIVQPTWESQDGRVLQWHGADANNGHAATFNGALRITVHMLLGFNADRDQQETFDRGSRRVPI